METREEIEDMKVSELREFLKRHGKLPTHVTRLDGTPGQPRKADLLSAALLIEQAYRTETPLDIDANPTMGPYASQQSQPEIPNPFQSKLPSPSSRRVSTSGRTTPTRRNSMRAMGRDPAETIPSTSDQTPPPRERTRRRSTPWVDPSLLKTLSATPRQAKPEATAPSNRTSSVARPVTPDRPTPAVNQGGGASRVSIPASSEPELRDLQRQGRREAAVRDYVPSRDETISRRYSRSEQASVAERPIAQGRPVADEPPPPPPRRSMQAAKQSKEVVRLGSGPLLEDDENDLDYDAAAAMAAFEDIEDNSDNDLFDADALEEDRDDILVQSDYESGTSVVGSDVDSTVDTDDEIRETRFENWSVVELKKYLSRHGTRFPAGANKSDLVCLVRAHSLQLETGIDQAKAATRATAEVEDEDVITPAIPTKTRRSSTRQSARRRRIISAPTPDDDDDNGIEETKRHRNDKFNVDDFAAKRRASRQAGRKKTKPKPEGKRRWVAAFTSFFTKSLFPIFAGLLMALAVWAGVVVLRESRKPYCSQDSQSKLFQAHQSFESRLQDLGVCTHHKVDDIPWPEHFGYPQATTASKDMSSDYTGPSRSRQPVVEESSYRYFEANSNDCVPCPKNGDCSSGALICDPGYISVGNTCVEDKDNTAFAAEIARDGYLLLAHHAGRAECGEVESAYLTETELREALEVQYAERKEKSFFPWMHREYDPVKFSLAFGKAMSILRNEDFEQVSYRYDSSRMVGEYGSNEVIRSFWCATKLMLWRNWQLVTAFFIVVVLGTYLRIYLFLKRREQRKLADAYRLACDHLSDRKRGYLKGEEEFAFIPDVSLRQEVLGYPTQKTIEFWKQVEEVLKNDKRIAYTANKTIKGMPSNTFEWRGRMSTGDFMTSDGSVRSYEGSVYSEGLSSHATPTRAPVTPNSRLESVRRWLWNN